MVGEVLRQVIALEFDVDQVHRERELVGVESPILIDVGQPPDLGQDGVRQLRLDHLLLGGGAGDLALDGVEGLEDGVPLAPLFGDDPLRLSGSKIDSLNK